MKKIIVENNIAKGVQLEDGSEHFADQVISAADGYSTIVGMLGEKYTTDLIREYYGVDKDTRGGQNAGNRLIGAE